MHVRLTALLSPLVLLAAVPGRAGAAPEPVEIDDAGVVAPTPEPVEIDEAAELVAPAPQPQPQPEPIEIDEAAEVVAPEPQPAPIEIDEATELVAPAPEPEPEPSELPPTAAAAQHEPSATDAALAEESEESAEDEEPAKVHQQRWRAIASHLHPAGFVQVDFLWRQISIDELSDGSREPLNETAFVLRNARVGLDADWRYIGVTAFADLFSNNQGVRPATVDVHAQYPGKQGEAPLVQLRVGLLRVPFGFENANQNDVQRFFGERSLVSHAYMPGLFDVGAALSGHVWAFDWIVGVYNGQPMGAPGFGLRDPNAAKDFVGRLRLSGQLHESIHAGFGVSLLHGTGFSAGTGPTKDSFVWVDLNEDGRVTLAELLPVPGAAGRPSENFRRWGTALDFQLRASLPRVGDMTLYGELALGNNLDRAVAVADPVGLGRDQRGLGWYLGLTQELTRYAMIGLRYDDYLPNLDALEPFDGTFVITRGRFQTIAAGAAARIYAKTYLRARLLFEYEHQLNTLGRDAAGRPAQLDNDTFRIRTEVAF